MGKGQLKPGIWQSVGSVGSIGINARWKDSHEKGNKKGEVDESKASDALAMFVIVVLNVVHVVPVVHG